MVKNRCRRGFETNPSDGGGEGMGHFGGVSGATVVVDLWNMEARVTSARADSR
jgi:hypothetical protein